MATGPGPSDPAAETGIFYTEPSGGLLARRYKLKVTAGPDAGAELDVEHGTVLVGTHTNADLRLSDKGISRYHVELKLNADGLQVNDLDSTNGTFLGIGPNATRLGSVVVSGPAQLRLGPNTHLDVTPADIAVSLDGYIGERFGEVVGSSPIMRDLFGLLSRVAVTDATVLLEGETGTGKELLAEGLHQRSPRHRGPFVVVDCGALPRDLAASELFGHLRGAFTGAISEKKGLLEEASGGTLFLDEIGELPLELQPQLLRALEKREVRPVGEVRSRKIDIRVVAATHRNLSELVRAGSFREDLFFRLAVVRVQVPPLRRRKEDLALLCRHFMAQLPNHGFELSSVVMAELMAHDWPGNVRELRNVVERGLSLDAEGLRPLGDPSLGEATGQPVDGGAYAPPGVGKDVLSRPFKEAKGLLLESFEREYLTHLLQRNHGNISRAAHEAGIDRNYIHRLVKKYNLPVDRD